MACRVAGSEKIEVLCGFCGARLLRYPGYTAYYCDIQCKADWQRTQKPATRDWLYQKYVVEELDCPEIARMVGREQTSVHRWLEDYGIPIRPRGSSTAKLIASGKKIMPSRKGATLTDAHKQMVREARKRTPNLPHLVGGRHYLKGKRGAETPNWKGGVTPERQNFYDSPEWKSAVKAVWKRDDAKCQGCGIDHRTIPTSQRGTFAIHHIVSFANRALRAEPTNLVLLCRPCHLWVHSRRNTERKFLG